MSFRPRRLVKATGLDIDGADPDAILAALEKAKKDLQEQLAQMTPEERREAALKAKKMLEEDEAEPQRLLETAAKLKAGEKPTAPAATVCPHCGAAISGGKFCGYCGQPL